MYKTIGKRLFDIVMSLCLMGFFLPVFIYLAFLVKLKLGSPIIFTQYRVGANEKVFKLYKFRSMSNEKDANGNYLPDSKRLNNFGKVLRSTSLDELPEVYNILKGEMSFVGPRPLLVEYLPFYNEHDRRRHEVRPGLTGLAQVCGRNNLSWKDKFYKDVFYIDNMSFLSDIKILILTVKKSYK